MDQKFTKLPNKGIMPKIVFDMLWPVLCTIYWELEQISIEQASILKVIFNYVQPNMNL